jgi:hypothetical protein
MVRLRVGLRKVELKKVESHEVARNLAEWRGLAPVVLACSMPLMGRRYFESAAALPDSVRAPLKERKWGKYPPERSIAEPIETRRPPSNIGKRMTDSAWRRDFAESRMPFPILSIVAK